MALTLERTEKIGNYLKSDPDKAKKLLEMNAEDALKLMNADGNDFTVDELREFDALMVATSTESSEELDADALESVAGGLTVATAALVVSIVKWGAPYAWRAGQWIGKKICGR